MSVTSNGSHLIFQFSLFLQNKAQKAQQKVSSALFEAMRSLRSHEQEKFLQLDGEFLVDCGAIAGWEFYPPLSISISISIKGGFEGLRIRKRAYGFREENTKFIYDPKDIGKGVFSLKSG